VKGFQIGHQLSQCKLLLTCLLVSSESLSANGRGSEDAQPGLAGDSSEFKAKSNPHRSISHGSNLLPRDLQSKARMAQSHQSSSPFLTVWKNSAAPTSVGVNQVSQSCSHDHQACGSCTALSVRKALLSSC